MGLLFPTLILNQSTQQQQKSRSIPAASKSYSRGLAPYLCLSSSLIILTSSTETSARLATFSSENSVLESKFSITTKDQQVV
jgi:hypothetical protein